MRKAKRIETSGTGTTKAANRPYLLYFFLSIMFVWVVLSLVSGEYRIFLFKLGAFAIMSLASTLMQKGMHLENEYKRAILAKAPAVPYKTLSSILLFAMIFYIGVFITDRSFWSSLFVSILGGAGALMYYGRDPAGDKLPSTGDVDPDILLKSLNEARAAIESIKRDNTKIHDRILHEGVKRSVAIAEEILDAIASDPGDMRTARKFLVVFIDGVANITSKYTSMEEKDVDSDMRERLYALLDDVKIRFNKELERLKSSERFDLDVQIDVLKQQIKD